MIKVLFVCLGNICRSPLAEAIFNHKIKKHNLVHKFCSDSCGTSDYHIGELPDERTIDCAVKNQITIKHRARQINRVDLREFHYLIAMDYANKNNIKELLNGNGMDHERVFLIREFQPEAQKLEVPDPYYGGEEGFEEVYTILDDAIEYFLEHLRKSEGIDV
jgi:protein-tyrosine phosphatase